MYNFCHDMLMLSALACAKLHKLSKVAHDFQKKNASIKEKFR
jgi:hypothetical protein